MTTEGEQQQLVFFVVGATGSRKSAVAIQLARHLESYFDFTNVVVVNCDVPQFYAGLPIGTNKASEEEMNGVPHFFLGFLDFDGKKVFSPTDRYPRPQGCTSGDTNESKPLQPVDGYKVFHYEVDAEQFIDEHFRRNRKTAVIVCGGTCYYAQAVLFRNTLTQDDYLEKEREKENQGDIKPSGTGGIEADGDTLWAQLHSVDPKVAARYHPHDTRRIQRLLDIYRRGGKTPSEVFQAKEVTLRYSHSFVIWTSVEKDVLQEMISSRVEVMVGKGLLDEVQEFHRKNQINLKKENEGTGHRNHHHGTIMESIGYKEFLPCMEELHNPTPTSAVRAALERVKCNTWRYARQQTQFIRNRLAPLMLSVIKKGNSDGGTDDSSRVSLHLVKVDTTVESSTLQKDLKAYLENVVWGKNNSLGGAISTGVLAEAMLSQQESEGEKVEQGRCYVCDMVVCGSGQMAVHLDSKRHRGAVKRQRLEQEQWEKYGRVLPPRRKTRK